MTLYFPEKTVKYTTFLKASICDALQLVFKNHPDPKLKTSADNKTGVKVTLEYPKTQDRYPAILVRYYERSIERMGVAHQEYILIRETDPVPTRMFHNIFKGDLELSVMALSNYDRDLVRDTLVQTITMGVLETWTNNFFDTIYPAYTLPVTGAADGDPVDGYPDSHWHFINVNSDSITGFGETEVPVPWGSEDDQLYNVSYRVNVLGEFYSVPPTHVTGGFVSEVDVYEWMKDLAGNDLEPVPQGADDPAEWEPADPSL